MPELRVIRSRRIASVRDVVLADGRSVRVQCWKGSGTPIVFLHGLLDSSEGWADVARSTARPCVAFDLPGFGGSSQASSPHITSYVEDVLEVLDELKLRRFVLIGHSLGGAIAAALADFAPGRVAALGLLAPAGFGRIALAELASIPIIRNAVQAALPLALGNRFAVSAAYMTVITAGKRPRREVVDRITVRARQTVPGARDATEAIVHAGLAPDAMHKRRLSYRGPVRVLWGRHDRLVPLSHIDGVQKALPKAQIEIASFGHHPQQECWDRLVRIIDELCALGDKPAKRPARTRRAATA